MNPLPPFNLSVVYSGKSLGIGHKLPKMDVHSIDVQSKDLQYTSAAPSCASNYCAERAKICALLIVRVRTKQPLSEVVPLQQSSIPGHELVV
eukprot:3691597-Amphidinium_carterae.1